MFNNTDKRYNQFSAYLKNRFGAKVYKITIDAENQYVDFVLQQRCYSSVHIRA